MPIPLPYQLAYQYKKQTVQAGGGCSLIATIPFFSVCKQNIHHKKKNFRDYL